VLLHEMMTGTNPLQPQTHAGMRNRPLRALATPRAPEVTFGLQYVLDRCMARAPGDRYQDMRDLLADLAEVRSRAGCSASLPHAAPRPAPRGVPWTGGPAVGWVASSPTRPQVAGPPLVSWDACRPLEL
jgi:hypothetical protein